MDRQTLCSACGPFLDFVDRHPNRPVLLADDPEKVITLDILRLCQGHRLIGFGTADSGTILLTTADQARKDPEEVSVYLLDEGTTLLAEWRLTQKQPEGSGQDDASFRPAKEIRDLHPERFPTEKHLRKFLGDHPDIPTRRPRTKAGKPNPHRLDVHAGAVLAALEAEKAAQGSIDPENLPAEKVDALMDEVRERETRKDELDEERAGKRR